MDSTDAKLAILANQYDLRSWMAGVEDFAHYLYVGDKLNSVFNGDVFNGWAAYRNKMGDPANELPRS